MDAKERFLNYVSFDTQANSDSTTAPSTMNQRLFGDYLVSELKELRLDNAYMDQFGYVYAYLPSNCQSQTTIGLIAHMDTAEETSGKNVKPRVIPAYDGNTITIHSAKGIYLSPKEFPRLQQQTNHELIVTDGTTLLGADDKAGIAIIMSVIQELLSNPEMVYPNLIITFTPDEEIGRGTNYFNYDYYKKYHCNMAYTLDGGEIEIINMENFNAATAMVTIHGKAIHPGSAKNKMINSLLIAMELQAMLPQQELPSTTEKYEGFNHLTWMEGSVEQTRMEYIIRNHDMEHFLKQKALFSAIAAYLNTKYGAGTVEMHISDSYLNMKDLLLKHAAILQYAIKALKRNGIEPCFDPIRGGTDGARLSFEGIYTPNLGTGGANFHGPYEYLDVTEMKQMIQVVITLLHILTEK